MQQQVAVTSEVATDFGQLPFVEPHQQLDGAFSNAERRQVGKEVVAHQHTKEYEVVDDTLQVPLERQRSCERLLTKLKCQVLP